MHPEPLAEPDVVGMELGRAAVRWRVTIPALSVVRWVPISTSVTSPEAPLQSRKVGFPDSGFRLGFPQEAFPRMREAKALARIHPTHSGLPRSSSLKSGLFRFASLTHAKTAKCSELLCLPQSLLVTGWRPAPPRRALPLLPRSYELMRQTSSLLENSCSPTYFPRSLQVAASPCWQLVLPDVTSASLSQDA